MNRASVFSTSVLMAFGVALLPSNVVAQQKSIKEQLVGTWTFVSSTTKLPDGSPAWGINPEENKAVVQGTSSTFGTYTVDETKKTYTLKFEGSSFPNRAETEQTRAFTIVGDELKIANPSTSVGGSSELVYKRAN